MTSKKVFIDSSVLLAFVDRSEVNHPKAVKTMENLARLNSQIYTSQQAISEVYTALSREAGIAVALDFLQACLQSDMEILFPQKADLIVAHRLLRANRDRQLTLREALNACLMQKRGITQIVSFTYWQNLFGTSVVNIT
ncbi:type II toxin-antitoxin system VapC family toxin [Candidatus Daviesbacteria bacterium]|nr:type II toxin-antitoxin system VapC family toxin [Candidatus Daviesbacteria bacterium]